MISRRVSHRIMSRNRARVWISRGAMFRWFSHYSPLLLVTPVEDNIDSFTKGEVRRVEKRIAESFACGDSTHESVTQSLREFTEVTSRFQFLEFCEKLDERFARFLTTLVERVALRNQAAHRLCCVDLCVFSLCILGYTWFVPYYPHLVDCHGVFLSVPPRGQRSLLL